MAETVYLMYKNNGLTRATDETVDRLLNAGWAFVADNSAKRQELLAIHKSREPYATDLKSPKKPVKPAAAKPKEK